MEHLPPAVLSALLLGIIALTWYLLRQKDEKQAQEIKLLWEKYDTVDDNLQKFKLQIAREHYVKSELDIKFDKLENAVNGGFKDLEKKVDKLLNAVTTHVLTTTKE